MGVMVKSQYTMCVCVCEREREFVWWWWADNCFVSWRVGWKCL